VGEEGIKADLLWHNANGRFGGPVVFVNINVPDANFAGRFDDEAC